VYYTCGTNGAWQGNINCRRKNCGPTPQPLDKNADADCRDTLYEDTCTIG
jgi:hypothetical protein